MKKYDQLIDGLKEEEEEEHSGNFQKSPDDDNQPTMSNGINRNNNNNNNNIHNNLAQVKPSLANGQAAAKRQQTFQDDEAATPKDAGSSSIMRRTLTKINKKQRRLRRKFNKGLSGYTKSLDDELAYSERQNSVQTGELFKYAQVREKLAICLGVLFMFYAASWQPISVFILATMASLMGQYAKQSSLLNQMLVVEPPKQQANSSSSSSSHYSDIELMVNATNTGTTFAAQQDGQVLLDVPPPQIHPGLGAYTEQVPWLVPFHSFVAQIFDLGSSSMGSLSGSGSDALAAPDAATRTDGDEVKLAVDEILWHESHQFLRRSFEINGSAFLLGLSQLTAFFLGMTLITWAAKRQGSRLKILYFKSCLHQEVTWYESIDSASGSSSSLNALVDKYQDGIGPKLALLCYFLGHVTLFACTAFYQMLSLASFCTCFVITIGLIIIYLSGGQAVAIGEHALFAKRALQLAEEILASIRTVFAFNGQQKELTRYQLSLEPVYRKSLIKHLYTALNTSLSKFSIFACFSAYCFYARHLFPPYTDGLGLNKATVLAVMRGGEVSIVNILISIPFMEALQQSKGSIARIYAAIERRSKIDPSSVRGARPASSNWQPSISFRMVQFGYADRAGPTQRRRSTLPQLAASNAQAVQSNMGADLPLSAGAAASDHHHHHSKRRTSLSASANKAVSLTAAAASDSMEGQSNPIHGSGKGSGSGKHSAQQSFGRRRRSIIDELADEFANDVDQPEPPVQFITGNSENLKHAAHKYGAFDGPASANTIANQNQPTIKTGIRANELQHKNCRLDHITATGGGARRINDNNSSDGQYNGDGSCGGCGCDGSGANPARGVKTTATFDVDRDYQTQDKRILNRFNLEIKAGQSVALVGPSGSGKSTVLSLLLRLYDITGGQLLIGQHNIKDLNVQWLRNQIGVVTQEPRLFDMSIADNIRLGLPVATGQQQKKKSPSLSNDSSASGNSSCDGVGEDELMGEDDDFDSLVNREHVMQQVVEASKAAGAHDFIVKLPQGYSTRVGSGGVQLSGGQKQRIAIARALIRQPKLLLLDESTSALDTESETQVLKALQLASAGRTTITVAHRLKTIKHVDLIVVMSQGQVIECGTHDELMALEAGTYKRMYQDQIEANEGQKRRRVTGGGGGCAGKGGRLDPLKSSEFKGGLHDQIRLVTPGSADNNGGADKTSQDEDRLHNDEYDDNDDSDGDEDSSSSDEDDDDVVHDSDDDYCDDHDGRSTSGGSDSDSAGSTSTKPNFWTLLHFVEPPKWTSIATIVVCLLAGLVLPMNLIAHSYLFSAFAYNELEQIGEYLHFFGLVLLSFSSFVFIVTFLQVILPGYVGEKISTRLRAKTMDSFLHKPMFYFDMDANSAGSLCDRLNSYISNIQNIAGTRIATMLEAVSTLIAGAIFGFGENLTLSTFCLSFALLVLITTVIESRIVQRESSIHQKYDAQLAHLMADSLSNIKTIASLNKESFFIDKFSSIIQHRERGVCPVVLFAVNDTFRALVFLPELLKARKSIERLYRMNREFSPEVLQTQSLAQQLEQQNRLHLEQMAAATNEFSSVISNQEATIDAKANKTTSSDIITANNTSGNASSTTSSNSSAGSTTQQLSSSGIHSNLSSTGAAPAPAPARARPGGHIARTSAICTIDSSVSNNGSSAMTYSNGRAVATAEVGRAATLLMNNKAKKSISFVEPARSMNKAADRTNNNYNDGPALGANDGSDNNRLTMVAAAAKAAHSQNEPQTLESQRPQIINRRMSNLGVLPAYMRRKSSRLNSLVPRYQSRGRIEFRDVEFAYPNRPSALVLDGFSLSVAPGESVALVGGSGCGKSTCVSILEKFYDYHGGNVTVDGYDLRLVDPHWVRSQIGLVSQEPTLLSYTIGDNIRYGDNGRFVSMDEVVEAARTANIHDFIMSLPDQYDTELSTSAYSSSQLSGGQRQRIAIARALVRNAPILIFDEATSALDPSNEAIVQDALNKARKGRTSLTIAHRLSTIKDSDKIVVLNEGKVVEIGKHDELIKRPNGHYRNLWEKHEGTGAGAGEDGRIVD